MGHHGPRGLFVKKLTMAPRVKGSNPLASIFGAKNESKNVTREAKNESESVGDEGNWFRHVGEMMVWFVSKMNKCLTPSSE